MFSTLEVILNCDILLFFFFRVYYPLEMSGRDDEFNDNTERDLNNQSDDTEVYSYSDDSISSDDFTEDSEVTSVTGTSSLSEETSFSLSKESPVSTSKTSYYHTQTYSSLNVGPTSQTGVNCARRRNMSFSNMEMMRIERENQCLLRKIMAQQKKKKSIGGTATALPGRLASSAINRKKMQRRIEEDNITILRKIQGAKSSSLSGKTLAVYEST